MPESQVKTSSTVLGTDANAALVLLVDSAIDHAAALEHLEDPCCGGRVVFDGVVRDNSDGRAVDHLEYQAYEAMAVRQMTAIAAQMLERWPVRRVVLIHRVGCLAIGDLAVVVGASGVHREEAFGACRYGIDRIKSEVPIWKREFFRQGPPSWGGSCSQELP